MTSTLPPEVLDLVEMSPVEDLLLSLLPMRLAGIPVKSLIADDQTFPFVLVRRAGDWGEWSGDTRFVDAAQINVHCFAGGVNADEDAALLSEAVRVILRDSLNVVVPQRGHLIRARMVQSPTRVPDWNTSTGPVQYADLPTGVMRYETKYEVAIRKPATRPFPSTP